LLSLIFWSRNNSYSLSLFRLIPISFITKKEDVFIINTQLQILFNQFIKYLKTIGVIRKDDKIKVGGRLMQKAT